MEDNKSFGQVEIADEVIAIIAGTAAVETTGVYMAGNYTDSLVKLFGKKNLAKGVKVDVEDGEVTLELEVAVEYGVSIKKTAEEVQKKVVNAVETMTGLKVVAVNVNVAAIASHKSKAKEEAE
ncbi:MAG: Asp23/Gls24 family envelope stress response protein [Firmicutes bacterium]|nr:Asp23/Gls24 family envelope stress response protein [Bacillota bacterium]